MDAIQSVWQQASDFLLGDQPRPGLHPIPGTKPVTIEALVLPPLIYYVALLFLPPAPPSAVEATTVRILRNTLAVIAGILFYRLPLAYYIPQSIGLNYQLSLVGLYGGCRVLDVFFISPFFFNHIPRRVRYEHKPRVETPVFEKPDEMARQSANVRKKRAASSNWSRRPSLPLDSYIPESASKAASNAADVAMDTLSRTISGPAKEPVYQFETPEDGWPHSFLDRASWALELELSMRGMGFTWTTADVRHTRKTWLPTIHNRLHSIFVHVAPLMAVCLVIIRMTYTGYLEPGGEVDLEAPSRFDERLSLPHQLLLTAALGAFLMLAFSLAHSMFAIMCAPLAPSPFAFFPPLYTTPVWQITSVRAFWSYGWHRLFARLFLVYGVWPGQWLERTILRKRSDEPADIGKVLGGFISSAFVHSFSVRSVLAGDWSKARGEGIFFASNGLAVAVEEGVRRVVVARRKRLSQPPSMWHLDQVCSAPNLDDASPLVSGEGIWPLQQIATNTAASSRRRHVLRVSLFLPPAPFAAAHRAEVCISKASLAAMKARCVVLAAALSKVVHGAGNSTITRGRSGTDTSPTGTLDLAYASSCNQARLEWAASSGQSFVSNTSVLTTTSSVSSDNHLSAWIETEGPTSIYTLCDGWPRMNATTEYRTSRVNTTTTLWSTFTTDVPVYRNVSAPDCSFGSRECSALRSSYNASSSQWSNWYFGISGTSQPSPTSPICYSTTTFYPEFTTMAPLPYPPCIVTAATIQLLYWPVSTIGNRLCGGNWTTVVATPTIEGQPNTAVGLNTTFTSPTVYMVMSGAYEVNDRGGFGPTLQGILPMSSDRVRSKCALGYSTWGPPETMDYADFDPPFQASKYRCQPDCWTNPVYWQSLSISTYSHQPGASENLCSTIYDGAYRPALELPVTDINSYFAHLSNGIGLASCSLSVVPDGIFFDPPSALQQVQSAPGPSAPSAPNAPEPTTTAKYDPQSTPASPGPTLTAALPETTGGGAAVPQPTRPNAPDASNSDDNNDDPATGHSQAPNGNNGSNGENGDDEEDSEDTGDEDSSSPDPTPTQNIGDIIASIMGMQQDDSSTTTIADAAAQTGHAPSESTQQNPADPAPTIPASNPDPAQGDPQRSPAEQSSNQSGASRPNGSINGDQSHTSDQPATQPENPSDPEGTAGETSDPSSPGDDPDTPSQGSANHGDDSQDIVYAVDGKTLTAHAPPASGHSSAASNVLVVAPGVTLTEGGEAFTLSETVDHGTTAPARTYSLAAPSSGDSIGSDGEEGSAEEGGQGGQLVVDGVTATRVRNGAITASQTTPTPAYSSASNGTASASLSGTGSASAAIAEQTGNLAAARGVPGACWALPLLALIAM